MDLQIISRRAEQPVGPPLLFVHGSFSDARIWEPNFLPFFAGHGFDAHAVSLRGHGRSAGRARLLSWRLSHYVDDLAQAVDTLDAPPVLVGYSMGGMVVQKYLERGTEVAGMVLMGSVPPQGLGQSNLHMAMRHPLLFSQLAAFSLMGPKTGPVGMMRRMLFSRGMPAADIARYTAFGQPESQMVSLDMMGLDPLLLNPARVEVPVLVMGAEDDVFVSPVLVRQTARFYGAECVICPHLAHAMMLDLNWRTLAEDLLAWLVREFVPHPGACAVV